MVDVLFRGLGGDDQVSTNSREVGGTTQRTVTDIFEGI